MRKYFLSLLSLAMSATMLMGCSDDTKTVSSLTPPTPPNEETDEPSDEPGNDKPGGSTTPFGVLTQLKVDGRYLKNEAGEIINLHGFTQTYSPHFNNMGWWGNDNNSLQTANDCVAHNKKMVNGIINAGWKFNFCRMHLDPWWSNDPSKPYVRYEGHEQFSPERFEQALERVFIPMMEYFNEKGMYVVMRPPGVCPDNMDYENDGQNNYNSSYADFLREVWDIVSSHPKIKNNKGVMFELANEPVNIKGTDGRYSNSGDAAFTNMQKLMQSVVDVIRDNGAKNVIWVPGLCWQQSYIGYLNHPINDNNFGYAIHCYPGWYGSDSEADTGEGGGNGIVTVKGGGYETFQRGWDSSIKPVAEKNPIMVTEIDWAPKKYDHSWGKSITGTAGGEGFGSNFKYIADNEGNVSWLFFGTDDQMLTTFNAAAGPGYQFINDPEACAWPIWHWFKNYAEGELGHGEPTKIELVDMPSQITLSSGSKKDIKLRATYYDGYKEMVSNDANITSNNERVVKIEKSGSVAKLIPVEEGSTIVKIEYTSANGESFAKNIEVTVEGFEFSFANGDFDPNIWEKGSWDNATKTLITGQYGFGGWTHTNGIDFAGFRYIIIELGADSKLNSNPQTMQAFRLFTTNNYWSNPATVAINSRRVVVDMDNLVDGEGKKVERSKFYILGFWTAGGEGNKLVIDNMYLSNSAE